MMIRAVLVILTLSLTFLVLAPLHVLGLVLGNGLRRKVPVVFHRIVCRLLGVRIHEIGERASAEQILILSNHASWLDISVLSALAPVVFVAKSEVAGWPVFGLLAKLQRTVFIEREQRHKTGEATAAMASRLDNGDSVVLFPEGTSSNGTRILPFRSALVGAVHHTIDDLNGPRDVVVQPVSLAYVRFGGVPVGRALRDKVAWYGEADLVPHLLGVLSMGAIDVTVSWGDVIACNPGADRKYIARRAESAVRTMTAAALRGAH
ncbi:phospholipid/glycerol acyltransferase [Afipia carboxidovorans OM5]|nr:phospholipid/glycerol acyltransferase [Afipia carboxidovorans OM5]